MWGTEHGMGWWMLFGSIWMVVFWGLITWAIVTVLNRDQHRTTGDDSPLDIAKRRYAKGEINREEFEQIHCDLSG